MSRTAARKRALSVLYEADERDEDIEGLLKEREDDPGIPARLPEYAKEIVKGVAERKGEIDRLIAKSSSWNLERIAVVDRNILRISAWECLFKESDGTPSIAYINEAVKLAKIYCGAKSVNFVYGVLKSVIEKGESRADSANGERADG